MIGNEQIHPDHKFVELFRRLGKLEADLAHALEQIAELHAVINFVPPGLQGPMPQGPNNRKTLSLKSGTR